MKTPQLLSEPVWYFPKTLDEVPELLKRAGVIPHGGGTMILRGSLAKIRGYIDLSSLNLRYFRTRDNRIDMGAALTYGETIEYLEGSHPDHILLKALRSSASTPLRNRITLGGSIAFFPTWTDLLGPLIALEARVSLMGEAPGTHGIAEYIQSKDLRRGNLISGIVLEDEPWTSGYHRQTRTSFDYPAFNLTVLVKANGKELEDVRIVIVGNTQKYKRLVSLEESLKGLSIAGALESLSRDEIHRHLDVRFSGKKLGSPEYVAHLCTVWLERTIADVLNDSRMPGKAGGSE